MSKGCQKRDFTHLQRSDQQVFSQTVTYSIISPCGSTKPQCSHSRGSRLKFSSTIWYRTGKKPVPKLRNESRCWHCDNKRGCNYSAGIKGLTFSPLEKGNLHYLQFQHRCRSRTGLGLVRFWFGLFIWKGLLLLVILLFVLFCCHMNAL